MNLTVLPDRSRRRQDEAHSTNHAATTTRPPNTTRPPTTTRPPSTTRPPIAVKAPTRTKIPSSTTTPPSWRSNTTVDVVAILTPAPGKEARIAQLLRDLTSKVEDQEHNVQRYMAYRSWNSEGVREYVFQERYKNGDTLEAHCDTAYFQELGRTIAEEGLLAKPVNIMKLEPMCGFDRR